MVASGATDGGVQVWDVGPAGAVARAPLPGDGALVEQVVWSPDGRTLAAAGDDDAVRLFDMTRPPGPPVATLTGPASYVFGAAWSPDSRTLTAVSADGTLRYGRGRCRHPGGVAPLPGGHPVPESLSVSASVRGATITPCVTSSTCQSWSGTPRW
ncbi:MAG: hypothetical protein J0I34_29655 [Pseudonocardia sp.]|uniref:WD40 repeat domain-containing protein n=1 Tax=Pseudonocardia sp. TaxID=60912 RepID=UPI001AD24D14|nr:hypothetical protein [Pseudonocardia sp.]